MLFLLFSNFLNETYNLRSGNHLAQRNIRTTQYLVKSVSNLGATIRDLLPRQKKYIYIVLTFLFSSIKLEKWISEKRPWEVCQTYIKISALKK